METRNREARSSGWSISTLRGIFEVITSEHFSKIKYHFIKKGFPGTEIDELIGLDSETLVSGAPFLFCTGDGRAIEPGDLLKVLFQHYNKSHFALWNMKFDSGSILYELPPGAIIYEEDRTTIKRFTPGKYELWTTGKTQWHFKDCNGIPIEIVLEYIPHKFLKVSYLHGGRDYWLKFWDICQFFASSLDRAAQKYLGEKKAEIDTKTFTIEIIEKRWKEIVKYCVQDARLTGLLGNFLLAKITEFGLRTTALYSQASISFRFFQDNGEIIGIPRYFKHYPAFVRVAMDAYEGGKFEVTTKGFHPELYEYDLTSAYPREIADLVNIDRADIMRTTVFQKDAVYGFMRCKVKIVDSLHVPAGLMINNTRVYAIGEYFITITKNEYLYYKEIGAEITILDGWFLFVKNIEYPYRDNVLKLFELKSHYKEKGDAALTLLCKVMLNGFYGKFCQLIEDWTGAYKAGVGFNPIYASVITANVRLKVCRIQNRYKDSCLAVHTDSVIMTEPLDASLVKKGELGEFEYVEGKAPGVLVACGCYQIGDAGAFKGFEPRRVKQYGGSPDEAAIVGERDETWFEILERYKGEMEIPYKALRVESWIEATAKGHFDKINKFEIHPKNIALNADVKRIWPHDDLTGRDLLEGLIRSEPVVIVQTEPPEYWLLPRHIKRRFKYGLKKDNPGTGAEGGGQCRAARIGTIRGDNGQGTRHDDKPIKFGNNNKLKGGKAKGGRTGRASIKNVSRKGKKQVNKQPKREGEKCTKKPKIPQKRT